MESGKGEVGVGGTMPTPAGSSEYNFGGVLRYGGGGVTEPNKL